MNLTSCPRNAEEELEHVGTLFLVMIFCTTDPQQILEMLSTYPHLEATREQSSEYPTGSASREG